MIFFLIPVFCSYSLFSFSSFSSTSVNLSSSEVIPNFSFLLISSALIFALLSSLSLTGIISTDKGVSGNTLSDMINRIQTDVVALNPGRCIILGGTNDLGSGNLTQMAADTVTITETLIKNYIEVCIYFFDK